MQGDEPHRSRAVNLISTLLVIAGVVRVLVVVLHDPLLGYANQYDMVRTSACVDLWPALPPPARYAAHTAAPLDRYVSEHLAGSPCYPSTGVAFVEFAKGAIEALRAVGLFRDVGFPLRAVGIVAAITLFATVIAFVVVERRRPWAQLAHATLFAIVLSDPALTLWMNTFYTEFGTMFFLYVAGGIVALAPGVGRPRGSSSGAASRPCAPLAVLGYGALAYGALLGLVWSRQQYAAFAVIPLLIVAPQCWRRARAAWFAAVVVVVASMIVQTASIAGLPAIRAANMHDVYLGAVLPSARHEARALTELGLPASCRQAIGSNWYVGMGEDPQQQCTEVDALGRLALLRLIPRDPALPWRVLVRGLPLTQWWWQHYLGMVAGTQHADWSHSTSPFAWSLADLDEQLPLVGYLVVVAAVAAAFIVTAAQWARAAIRGRAAGSWTCAMLFLSALGMYAPFSAIFGDGYVDASRHALLFHPAAASLLCLGTGRILRHAISRETRALRWMSIAGSSWIVVAAFLAMALVWGVRRVPVGYGMVGDPAIRRLDGDTYTMRGWAVDPWGVRGMRVAAYRDLDAKVPERSWVASYGHSVPGLSTYFPTYAGADHGGFALSISRSEWPSTAPCLRTWIDSRTGGSVEIDRRCVAR